MGHGFMDKLRTKRYAKLSHARRTCESTFTVRKSLMRRLTHCVLAVLLGGWSLARAQDPRRPVDPSAEYQRILASRRAQSDSARLHSLFDTRWRYVMTEYPEFATYVGYPGQNGRWTDNSLEAIARRAREVQEPLRVLHTIDRRRLSAKDRLSYDLFERNLKEEIEGNQFHDEYFAIHQLSGPQQEIASVIVAQPAVTASHYDDIVARLNAVPTLIDQTIALLQKGLETGITSPKVVLRDVPDQIRNQILDDPIKSPLLEPFTRMPSSIPTDGQARLRAEAVEAYQQRVRPAYQKLLTYFTETYLPRTRETISLSALPDGGRWYAFRARRNTTTTLSPDRIHQMGRSEVRRIRAEMDSIIASVRFNGSFADFATFLRTDPQFFYSDSASLIGAYRNIAKQIDPGLVKLFGRLPRLPYGVIPVPSYAAKSQTTAYYEPGSLRAGRPGYFFANTYDLNSRPKWEMEALTLHEAVPGHHLQLALAQEQEGLPEFRKFGGYTAFVEGWGLYAESLGPELGLYQDSYSKFGQLTYEIWRAIRLVLDTGIHAKGWTREQAINYFAANSAKAPHDIEVEVDRYIVWPGQALAYKIGELELKELRASAKAALGDKFDIRKFHDAELENGALPLDLLNRQVQAWIMTQKRLASH
jgi:uncharacterized protein (DUF885 family)